MAIEIVILCPGTRCRKCRKMIQAVNETILESGLETDLKIIDQIEELVKFNTWVLPALVVNGKMIARGYTPEKAKILAAMNTFN